MAGDITFGIRLTADAAGFIGTVRLATQEIDKLRGTAGQTNSTLKQMQTESQGLTTQMVALGVAIGDLAGRVLSDAIHGLVEWTKETVHAAAALSDLSTATGSSVEDLSRLTNSFKISGVSSDLLATALQRLSVGLSGADAESKLAGDTLNKLGISARDPAQALQELANKLETYADGANKAALVQAVLGRGAQVLIPALHDLASANQTGAVITAQQAAEAEKLEKQWRALSIQGGVLKTVLLSDLVPALNRFAEGLQLARAQGLGWIETIQVATAGALRLEPTMAKLKDRIAEINEKMDMAREAGFARWMADLTQELRTAEGEMKVLIALRDRLILSNVAAMGWTGDTRDIRAQQKPEAPNPFAQAKQGADDYVKALKAAEDELSRARVEFDNLSLAADQRLTPAILKLIQASQDPAFQKLTASQRQNVVNVLLEADAVEKATAKYKEMVEALNAVVDLDVELEAKQLALTDALKQAADDAAIKNDQLARENALIGQSDTAHQLLAADIEYETQVRKLATQAAQAYTVVLDEELQKLKDQLAIRKQLINEGGIATEGVKAAKAYVEEWKRALDTVQHGVADFLVDFVEHGSSAFKNLWENFKHWALQALAEVAAKQVVVSVIGAASGGGAASAAASGLGGGFNASSASNLLSFGSSAYNAYTGATSGLITTALLSDAFSGVAASLGLVTEAGATIAAASAEVGAGSAAVGAALTELGATVAAAVPVVGLFIAAAIIAYEYFSKAAGGPKRGGAYSDVPGANLYPGETSVENNAVVQQFVTGIGNSFLAYFHSLGGTGDPNARFGLAYDTDPLGTAQSRVSSAASVGGNTVFNQIDQNAGRDDASLQAGLQQQAARAILAALQSTELPKVVHDYLASIDAGSATLDQIGKVLQHAQMLEQIVAGLAAINLPGLDIDTLAKFAAGTETIDQTFTRVAGAYQQFVNDFTTDSEKLANDQTLVTSTFAALGVAVPENITAYRELVQSIDLSTDAGREMFSTLITISPAFLALQNAVTGADGAIMSTVDHAKLLNDKLALQAQIYALTGDAAGAAAVQEQQRQIALEALDPSLRALQQNLWDLQDAAAASALAAEAAAEQARQDAAAQQAANEIERQRSDMQVHLLELQGAASEALALKRQLELAAMDESLRPLQELINAQEDLNAANEAAAAAAAAELKTKTDSLSILAQIAQLSNNGGVDYSLAQSVLAQQRALQLDQLNQQDPTGVLAALTQQLWDLQDAAANAAIAAKRDADALAAAAAAEKARTDALHAAAEAQLAIAKAQRESLALAQGDVLAEALAANGTAWDKLIAQGNQLETLTAYYDGTAASTTALAQATQQYHQSLVQMISTIETLKGSIAALFNSNIRDFTLDGLDKQGQYAYLQSEVAQAMEELKTATDPARINALAQLIAGDQKQAYGLLDPDQKNAVRAEFIAGAQAANDLLQQRLQAAEEAAEKRNAQLVEDIKAAIGLGFDKPIQKMSDAGDKMIIAANTPKEVNVHVDVTDGGGSAVGTY